jgi:hypothetical protein
MQVICKGVGPDAIQIIANSGKGRQISVVDKDHAVTRLSPRLVLESAATAGATMTVTSFNARLA